VVGTRPVWTGSAPPSAPVECAVQIRAHGEAIHATITGDRDRITALLHEPVRAVAAGQAIVVYRPDPAGDVVLGSATIV
jgi:tRNA-specific 2-thiouridylase